MIEAVLDVVGNTEPDVLLGNVQRSVKRSLPWFDFDESPQGSVCLVGGGPSLVDTIDQLKIRHQNGAVNPANLVGAKAVMPCVNKPAKRAPVAAPVIPLVTSPTTFSSFPCGSGKPIAFAPAVAI